MTEAHLACKGKCRGLTREDWHCRAKPRCRWRIGVDEGLCLTPYTLHVSLVECRRIGGKVKQEHIASLGSIEGHLLLSFWAGIEPEHANAARLNLEKWFKASIRARIAFWRPLEEKLARLANRVNEDERAAIRAAIEKRIPSPTAAELTQNTVWTAADEVEGWRHAKGTVAGMVAAEEKKIAECEASLTLHRENIAVAYQPALDDITASLRQIERAALKGDLDGVLSKSGDRAALDDVITREMFRRATKR